MIEPNAKASKGFTDDDVGYIWYREAMTMPERERLFRRPTRPAARQARRVGRLVFLC